MKKTWNRIIAMLLVVCLCTSLVSLSALAIDVPAEGTEIIAEHTHNLDGWSCTQDEPQKNLICTLEEHTHSALCIPVQEPTATPTESTNPSQEPVAPPPTESADPSQEPVAPPTESTDPSQEPIAPPPAESTDPNQEPVAPPPAESTEPKQEPVAPPPAESTESKQESVAPPPAENTESNPLLSSGIGADMPSILPVFPETACGLEEHTHIDTCYVVVEGQWHCTAPSQSELDLAAVENFLNLVAAIPPLDQITLADGETIAAARNAYNNLTEDQLALLNRTEGRARSAMTALNTLENAEKVYESLGTPAADKLYKTILAQLTPSSSVLNFSQHYNNSSFAKTLESNLRIAINGLTSDYIAQANESLDKWAKTVENSNGTKRNAFAKIVGELFDNSGIYKYETHGNANPDAGRKIISKETEEEYFVYCSESSLAFPKNAGQGFLKVAVPSDWAERKNEVARVLTAGYPVDAYGLCKSDYIQAPAYFTTEEWCATLTQIVVWDVINGTQSYIGYGSEFAAYLYNYAMDGEGALPEGYQQKLDTIQVTVKHNTNLSYDVERGFFTGAIQLETNKPLAADLAKNLVQLDTIPSGITVKQGEETLQSNSFIDLASPVILEAKDTVAGKDLGAITFKYANGQSIDTSTFELFQTYDLTFDMKAAQKGLMPYQCMIGYQMKQDTGAVSLNISAGNLPDPVAPIPPTNTPEQPVTPPTNTPEQPVTPPTNTPEQPVTPPTNIPEQPVTPPTFPDDDDDYTPPAPPSTPPVVNETIPENPTPLDPIPVIPEADIVENPTPIAPAPEDEIIDTEIPLGPAVPEEEVFIVDEGIPLGDLPQTGTTSGEVNSRAGLELFFLSLAALSLVGLGVCFAVEKRRQDS